MLALEGVRHACGRDTISADDPKRTFCMTCSHCDVNSELTQLPGALQVAWRGVGVVLESYRSYRRRIHPFWYASSRQWPGFCPDRLVVIEARIKNHRYTRESRESL